MLVTRRATLSTLGPVTFDLIDPFLRYLDRVLHKSVEQVHISVFEVVAEFLQRT
jgi:hypothetical protein